VAGEHAKDSDGPPIEVPSDQQEGAGARFGGVMRQYAPRLLRFLELRTGSRADAQDLAQEAYMRLCRVPRGELIQKPESYLFRIAINLAGEFTLRRSKQPATVDIAAIEADLGHGDGGSYCEQLENRSEIQMLEKVLADLPSLCQAVLLLRKRDGYSHEEIAEKLSISPHTVHKYLTRALFQCRMALEREVQ
jgi:RNA polymerase sigma factor (sigma-70 family)